MADQLSNVECHKASIETISRMDIDSSEKEIKPLSRVDNNRDCIHSIDRIVVDSDAEISKRFPSVKGETETIESKPLMDINAVLINSVFVEQSNKVMSILSDKDFKVFSRSYILNRTIKLLDNDKIHGNVMTVTGKKMSENLKGIKIKDEKVITPFKCS